MKVAIAGYGQEGVASYDYWSKQGAELTIFDEKQPTQPLPRGVTSVISPDAFKQLAGFDLVVRTASLNPKKIKTNGRVWSATNEFFEKCPAQIIGVTGTKGKGTTASLIAAILEAAGMKVHLLGNIGLPALSVLADIESSDIVVFELSSFQLWDLQRSPQTAAVLMIEPDHQDVHASIEEYVEAKSHIATYQKKEDLLVYHPTNMYSAQIAGMSVAQKKRYLSPEGAYIKDGDIAINDHVICATTDLGLIGKHNLENVCAAITAAWNYTQDIAAIRHGVTSFRGLEHRLEFVRELRGVRYYNDSFSATPGATIAAIRSFENPEVVICGGYDRGLSFTELAAAFSEQSNVKKILLIGQTRHKIAEALDTRSVKDYEVLDESDLTYIVMHAQKLAQAGDVILLSPGCPSFDMFKNFYERGEQFKNIVGRLS